MTPNRAFILGVGLTLALAGLRGNAAPQTNTPVARLSGPEEAELMVCPICGGRFAWIGTSNSFGSFECRDCGLHEPSADMQVVRREPHSTGIISEDEALELRKRVLTIRPSMTFQQIEATVGLERFAKNSFVATNASGRVEMMYGLNDHSMEVVVTGQHRCVAPLLFVAIDGWTAKLETNGWQVIEPVEYRR